MSAPDLTRARETLRRVFGHEDFRPGQEEILRAIFEGRDVLAIMPTGAGKSLLYQLPALVGRGPAVVVSPLISLMRDQVEALRAKDVAAGALHSATEPEEAAEVLRLIATRRIRLLYLAPERLAQPGTIDLLRRLDLKLLAVDEAHCVSRWADDFRPDYAEIKAIATRLGAPQLVAVTATAGPRTRDAIVARLFARSPDVFVRSFARPNIALAFRHRRDRVADVKGLIAARPGQSGIVYCATRAGTDRLAHDLLRNGINARPYHAGLDAAARDTNQDRFLREAGAVMVATIAFGMGIDKRNVRFVCHADLPHSTEAYYQEIGRAGRDGAPAQAVAFVDPRLRKAQGALSPDAAAMVALAHHPGCRWQKLLAEFGEASKPCGACDICAGDRLRLRRLGLRLRNVADAARFSVVRRIERATDRSEASSDLPDAERSDASPASEEPMRTIAQVRLLQRLTARRDALARQFRQPPSAIADRAALAALSTLDRSRPAEFHAQAARILAPRGTPDRPARELLAFLATEVDMIGKRASTGRRLFTRPLPILLTKPPTSRDRFRATAPLPREEVMPIMIGLMLGMLLGALDGTIVSTALPTIGRALSDETNLPWVVTAYLLASVAVTPLYGKLSDIYGRRAIMLVAIALFIAGSIACALAPTMLVLALARGLQGAGGGGLISLAQTIIADIVPPRERGRYQVHIASVFATSSLAGPILGGFLSEHLHWTAIFWINLPLGLLAFVIVNRRLAALPTPNRAHRLDYLGSALLVVSSTALLLALSWGGTHYPWTSGEILGLLGAAIAGAALFAWRISSAAEPLIPLAVLANPVVKTATSAAGLSMGAFVGLSIFMPIYFETVVGLSASQSGLALIPLMIGTVVGSTLSGRLMVRIERYKRPPIVGLAVACVGLALLGWNPAGLSLPALEVVLAATSIGTGTLFPTATVAIQNAVARHDLGTATATSNFFRQIGSALLVAIFGTLVFGASGHAGVEGGAAHTLAGVDPALLVRAFSHVFLAAAGCVALSLAFFVAMPERPLRGAEPAAPRLQELPGE